MKTEFKDVAHLYKGCKCKRLNDDMESETFTLNLYNLNYYREWLEYIKPMLRPLSDITKEEAYEMGYSHTTAFVFDAKQFKTYSPEHFQYLLSHQFDLFGLIESCQAIDKTVLEKPNAEAGKEK